MLPFPKRPPAPNEYDLQTGDYVAYDAGGQPSRQPLWGRSAPVQPYGSVQVAPHVRADMRAYAPAPHSLAPVAMSHHAAGTGSYPAQTVVVRGRPDMRWGVTLAIAGALLGGVLGVTMNNGKHRAAADQAMTAAALPVAAAQPVPTAPIATPATPAPMSTAPISAAAISTAPIPQPAVVPQPPAAVPHPAVAAPNPFAVPPQPQQPPTAPPNAVATRAPAPQPQRAVAHAAPAAPRHHAPAAPHTGGSMVAAKVQAPAPAVPAPKGSEEAKLLKDARIETGLSLGGSN